MKFLPLALLAAVVFSIPSCTYLRQRFSLGEYSLKAAIEWAKKDSARVADSLKRIAPAANTDKRQIPEAVKREISEKKAFEKTLTDSLLSIEAKDPLPETPRSGYYIIAGSFSNHENAMDKIRLYSAQGYKPTIIGSTGRDGTRLELVSISSFSDRNEAYAFLKEFQSVHDAGAWVYVSK